MGKIMAHVFMRWLKFDSELHFHVVIVHYREHVKQSLFTYP